MIIRKVGRTLMNLNVKAIDIGNAMLKDGYKEGDVVPIATQQAEKWYKDASKKN